MTGRVTYRVACSRLRRRQTDMHTDTDDPSYLFRRGQKENPVTFNLKKRNTHKENTVSCIALNTVYLQIVMRKAKLKVEHHVRHHAIAYVINKTQSALPTQK